MNYSKEFENWFKKQSHLSMLEETEILEIKNITWGAWEEATKRIQKLVDEAKEDYLNNN